MSNKIVQGLLLGSSMVLMSALSRAEGGAFPTPGPMPTPFSAMATPPMMQPSGAPPPPQAKTRPAVSNSGPKAPAPMTLPVLPKTFHPEAYPTPDLRRSAPPLTPALPSRGIRPLPWNDIVSLGKRIDANNNELEGLLKKGHGSLKGLGTEDQQRAREVLRASEADESALKTLIDKAKDPKAVPPPPTPTHPSQAP